MKRTFIDLLDQEILLADGAMGTVLVNRGVEPNALADQNLMNPDLVRAVHLEYIRAGSRLIETNTFLANRMKLKEYGVEDKLEAINRAMFHRASQLLLNQDNSEERRAWVIIDEVREMGNLEGLSRLLTNGRSKGACFCGGYQTPSGMQDAVGEHVADEINDQIWSIALGRIPRQRIGCSSRGVPWALNILWLNALALERCTEQRSLPTMWRLLHRA